MGGLREERHEMSQRTGENEIER